MENTKKTLQFLICLQREINTSWLAVFCLRVNALFEIDLFILDIIGWQIVSEVFFVCHFFESWRDFHELL